MKILHTADVHFHESTLADLEAPCRHIVEVAREQEPDAIVVAGDLTTERGIIDNATAVAVRTWITELATCAPVYILAGNHDLTFREGQPNNLRAILADSMGSVLPDVTIVDTPATQLVRDGFGREIAFHFLPYPSVPTFHAVTGSADLGDVSDRLGDVVTGLAADHRGAAYQLLIYHGTVEGGRAGDEGAPGFRTRGQDIVLPTALLGSFDAVLCGHLHHPQSIPYNGGVAVYPGCVAPLTFGERTIEPRALVWDLPTEGPPTYRPYPLPVAHQRLQVEIGPDDWDESKDATLNLWDWVGKVGAEQDFIGARVKIKATLPKPRLVLLTPDIIESVRDSFHLDRLVVEKTEHEGSKLLLEDGQDRAARVDVVDSLVRYVEYIEDPGYVEALDDIKAIGREVEDDIRHDDVDPRYEFEPLALELVNYKQYADQVVNFEALPVRTGVLGETGVGKSNLILAVAAALYGGNPKSEGGKAKASLASMVRRGESSGMVRLVFRGSDGTYRITRRLKVNGKGVASSALFFEQAARYANGDTDWHAINEGTSRETQAAIERIVGPEALHWLTRHLRQHGVSAVKMTSGELADAINATLQLDFEARAEVAKLKLSSAVQARDAAHTRRETLAERIVPLAKIEQQEERARWQKKDAETNGVQDQQLIERMEAERVKLTERAAAYDAEVRRLEERHQQRARVQADINAVTDSLEAMEREAGAIPAAPDMDQLEAAHAESRHSLDTAQAELARLKDEAHQLDVEDAQTLGALEQSRMAVATKRQDAYRQHEAARRAVDDAAKASTLISRVPCRGERWVDPNGGEMDGTACELLAHAREAGGKLSQLTEAESQAAANLKAADQDHESAMTSLNAYKVEAQKEREQRDKWVRAAENAVQGAAEAVRENAQALESARGLVARRDAITARLAPARERLAVLNEQLAALPLNEGHYQEHREALEDITGQLTRLEAELRTRRERLHQYREQIGRADADIEQLALERQQRAQMLAEVDELKRQETASERRRLALDYYRRAVSRDGIPSLLLEQLAPQLEARVNDILEPVGRALKIDTERQLTTGKTKTEVTLSFRSPSSGDEFVPIAELSGGEEDLANLALAAGLARVSADMSGTTLGTVVLDEPCAGVSESLQSETLEVLDRIGQHVRRSIVVTHRRDLAAACDAVLEVQQNGAGSVVEVTQ